MWVTTGRGSKAAAGFAFPWLYKTLCQSNLLVYTAKVSKTKMKTTEQELGWSKNLIKTREKILGPLFNLSRNGQMWGHSSLPGGVVSVCRPLIDPCGPEGGQYRGH